MNLIVFALIRRYLVFSVSCQNFFYLALPLTRKQTVRHRLTSYAMTPWWQRFDCITAARMRFATGVIRMRHLWTAEDKWCWWHQQKVRTSSVARDDVGPYCDEDLYAFLRWIASPSGAGECSRICFGLPRLFFRKRYGHKKWCSLKRSLEGRKRIVTCHSTRSFRWSHI